VTCRNTNTSNITTMTIRTHEDFFTLILMSNNCRSLSHALKRDSRADTVMQSNQKTQIRLNRPCSAAGFCQITSDTSSAELMSSIPWVKGSGISRTMLPTIAYRENGTLQCQRRSKVSEEGGGLVQSFDSGPPSISNPQNLKHFYIQQSTDLVIQPLLTPTQLLSEYV